MVKLQQFYVFKFTSSRLAKTNFHINITMKQAKINDEIIALGDNHVLRSIRKLKGRKVDFQTLDKMFKERRRLARRRDSIENKLKIRTIDKDLDNLLFIPEYISVIMEKDCHYRSIIRKKIWINEVPYVRCLCGAGNARRNTVFFVQESLYKDLDNILKNGHNPIEITENKYNAYYALSASATYTVSSPRVAVVPDKEVIMTKRVDWIDRYDTHNETEEKDLEVKFNLWDGMGICSPELAQRWAKDLELDYTPASFSIRNIFIKGMVCVFDFHKFANEIAHKYTITDIYGNEKDVRNVDMIITESQFKLWKGYDSWEHYESCIEKNEALWGVTKFSPKRDKTSVFSNYQFLQVLNLDTQEKIEKICQPTLDWLRGIIYKDSNYALLYLLGEMTKYTKEELENISIYDMLDDYTAKAVILNRDMLKDPYLRLKLYRSLNRKIKEAYIGKLLAEGNFQTMIADPYAFCEYIFGLETKGLLKDKQHYSMFWNKRNVDKVVACRAPLTHFSEVNILNLQDNEETNKWYSHLYSGIVYNVWGDDVLRHADSDFDGDIVYTSNNETMLENVIPGNPITYQNNPTKKKIIKEKDLYKADIKSFNSKIGYITNCSTTLYSMLPLYDKETPEYKEIFNRLKVCRCLQGAEIDRAKGLIVKPFPKYWTNWTSTRKENKDFSEDEINFNNKILIEKRPMFMKHLYSKYKKQYDSHREQYDFISKTKYNLGIEDLLHKEDLTEEQQTIVNNYNRFNPLLETDCVMNNICKYMEKEIPEFVNKIKKYDIDEVYNTMYNPNKPFTEEQLEEMVKVYKDYLKNNKEYNALKNKSEDGNVVRNKQSLSVYDLDYISKDIQVLANLAVTINYKLYPKSNKDFCWNIFEKGILLNIYDLSDKHFFIPIENPEGNIEYMGKKFKNEEVRIEL